MVKSPVDCATGVGVGGALTEDICPVNAVARHGEVLGTHDDPEIVWQPQEEARIYWSTNCNPANQPGIALVGGCYGYAGYEDSLYYRNADDGVLGSEHVLQIVRITDLIRTQNNADLQAADLGFEYEGGDFL
jgi:hypothetical protein